MFRATPELRVRQSADFSRTRRLDRHAVVQTGMNTCPVRLHQSRTPPSTAVSDKVLVVFVISLSLLTKRTAATSRRLEIGAAASKAAVATHLHGCRLMSLLLYTTQVCGSDAFQKDAIGCAGRDGRS